MAEPANAARVRHMTSEDVDAVAALIHASWLRTYGPLMGEARAEAESARKHAPGTIASDLRRAHSESFVAETEGGGIVGHAHAKVIKGVLWLDRLHLAPGEHGRGLASALLHAVIANYVGEPSISLEVVKGNDRAIRFYEREGFIVTEERDDCGGIAGVRTLVMRRAIARA